MLGDLRYYADTKIDAFATPLSRAQLGAGLAMLGDKDRADATSTPRLSALAPPRSSQVPLA